MFTKSGMSTKSRISLKPIVSAIPLLVSSYLSAAEIVAFDVDGRDVNDRIVNDWSAVSDEILASYRGGFIGSDGFRIDFGFQQITAIDGVVQSQSRFVFQPFGAGELSALQLQSGIEQSQGAVEGTQETLQALSTILRNPEVSKNQSANVNLALGQLFSVFDKTNQSLNGLLGSPVQSTLPQEGLAGMPVSTLIQSGNQNSVAMDLANTGVLFNTVIQNSLDGQVIQNFQALNITLSNTGKFSSQSMNSLILPQLIQFAR